MNPAPESSTPHATPPLKNRHILARFGFAAAGLRFAWASERSFRTECGFAIAAALVLIVLRPGWVWAALIVLCSMVVMGLELVNSALEALVDHVHPGIAPAVKNAKDTAAASVLVAALGSLCIAAMMLVAWYSG